MQDDLGCNSSLSRHPSRPTSRNAFDENVESAHHELSSVDPQLVARAPSPCLPPVGVKIKSNGSNSFSSASSSVVEPADITNALSNMNISRDEVKYKKDFQENQNYLFDLQDRSHTKQHQYLKKSASGHLGNSSYGDLVGQKSMGVPTSSSFSKSNSFNRAAFSPSPSENFAMNPAFSPMMGIPLF